eukprot:3697827-Alexandrium_andersonii.AAC.1
MHHNSSLNQRLCHSSLNQRSGAATARPAELQRRWLGPGAPAPAQPGCSRYLGVLVVGFWALSVARAVQRALRHGSATSVRF